MASMRPILKNLALTSRRNFSTASVVNTTALNFWGTSINSGPAHETSASQTLTNSSSRLFAWSEHRVQPGQLEQYMSAQEGAANWLSGRVAGVELMGSWKMLSGDLDTCCHLWKFNNNEEDVDQLLDLQASQEYAKATAKVRIFLRLSKQFGYFDKLPYSESDDSEEIVPSVLDFEFEEKDDADKTLKFFEMIGKAKHEPSGEYWETTYGESSWRMAVMCMCLPEKLNRRHLINLTLVSSLASLGISNDENTEWKEKIAEVKSLLRENLPPISAGFLCELFEEHAAVRRNQLDGSEEHRVYRGILELEETVLRWEEAVKEGIPDAETKAMTKGILAKMASVGFPGSSRVKLFKDYSELIKLLGFWLEISKLLRLKRTGWVRCKVREPETVASHMYRMGIMGMLLSTQRSEVEEGDAAIVSICHDMAECLVGDITPHDKVSDEDKHKAEMDAMQKLVQDLPDFMCRDFFSSFKRYEDQKTGDIDAILTKDFDKFDMILQAFEYEKREKKGKFLQQFFDSTKDVFKSVPVKKWQRVLLEIREKHFSKTNTN